MQYHTCIYRNQGRVEDLTRGWGGGGGGGGVRHFFQNCILHELREKMFMHLSEFFNICNLARPGVYFDRIFSLKMLNFKYILYK